MERNKSNPSNLHGKSLRKERVRHLGTSTKLSQLPAGSIFQQAMGALPTPLIMLNQHYEISYINQEAEHFWNIPLDKARGCHWAQIVTLSDQAGRPVSLPSTPVTETLRLPDTKGWWHVKMSNSLEIPVQLSVAPITVSDNQSQSGYVVVFHEFGEMKQLVERLLHRCSHDPLTGLVNRPEFETRLTRAVAGAISEQHTHALLFMDLDDFKLVNDQYGHKTGDALLKNMAARFRALVRDRDTLARFGGDEFLLLMEHCSVEHAVKTARLLRLVLHKTPYSWGGDVIALDVSIGIAIIDRNSPTLDMLIAQADAACYVAKKHSMDHIRIYQHGDFEYVFSTKCIQLSPYHH